MRECSKPNGWRFAFLVALSSTPFAILLLLRFTVLQVFTIPATSGVPNLMVGDYILVSKWAYKNKDPLHGDIVVFKLPTDSDVDYVKRVIGLPGDKIQMLNGRLHINGTMVQRSEETVAMEGAELQGMKFYRETLPGGRSYVIAEFSDVGGADNTDIYLVPPDHFFAMGDNRDNSQDSRFLDAVGFVPRNNLVGKLWLRMWNTAAVPISGRPAEFTAP